MKTKTFLSASRLAVLTLVCILTFSLAACSGDESIDEILSEETTPITFKSIINWYADHTFFLFDHVGNNYVGSDTISGSEFTISLRQGKHHLVWINGLDRWSSLQGEDYGLHYDPRNKSVTTYNQYPLYVRDIAFCEKDIEVTSYLMPTQQIEFTNYIICSLQIKTTDKTQGLFQTKQDNLYAEQIGELTGVPGVRTVSLTGSNYELDGKDWPIGVYAHFEQLPSGQLEARADSISVIKMLCPLNGLSDIQLKAEIKDANGATIPATVLPKFSLRRGYTTVLQGPLFTGDTSDWTVTMELYKEEL